MKRMIWSAIGFATVACVIAYSIHDAEAAGRSRKVPSKDVREALVERGRYIIKTAGCNDCHTPGYDMAGGNIPESEWLMGSPMGWRGPWGTSYPFNLRLLLDGMTEEEWLEFATTTKGAPPMPWWSLHSMSKEDLRSVYAFIRYLGPKGEVMPAMLPPHVEPKPPYLKLDVVMDK